METKIFDHEKIAAAAALLRQGQLVAFPTETVYGLGAVINNETAVKNVYLAKGRPSDNPLIVHVASPEMVWRYARPNALAQQLMTRFWPGPLTIILPLRPDSLLAVVTGGLTTAAFRMPDNQATLTLIQETGIPIVGPSANTSGKPSPTTAQHVYHDLAGKIAGILDDGPTKVGLESTVVDLSVQPAAVLRPGYITASALTPILGEVETEQHHVAANEIPKAPGMKYKHYAPNAQVLIVAPALDFVAAVQATLPKATGSLGVLAFDDQLQQIAAAGYHVPEVTTFALGDDLQQAAQELFAGLRDFDDRPEIKTILAAGVPENGLGIAYMNRLKKSAGGQFFAFDPVGK
ncbi:L-threonylcarbamoyladenylate synthase [Lapidilactobacillus luobeiensis]|uniref:L-threonylcarbamoyladenylate synthase n=1 Tax=Lapidilactobacillus luobeiensis TaxID=2950371 RepID=UPI0021C46990|nr:L-threonylcarbamoyladenylate synthase [Lapidilactobacillus luobeiensis]